MAGPMTLKTSRDRQPVLMGVTLVVLTALLFAAFPSSAQEESEQWPETVVVIGVPNMDHESGYQEWDCESEQLALGVTDYPGCGDFGGEHVRESGPLVFGFRSIDAGNHGTIPLTGELSARLSWDTASVTLTCRWSMGEFETCYIFGQTLPGWGEPFDFTCESEDGSIGGWAECFIGHA